MHEENKIVVGIPRALLYHRYGTLWQTFLAELDSSGKEARRAYAASHHLDKVEAES